MVNLPFYQSLCENINIIYESDKKNQDEEPGCYYLSARLVVVFGAGWAIY